MVRTVRSNPENIYVATDYKKIGNALELNRQRVTNLIASISRSNTDAQLERLDELVGNDGITDAEKGSLARELDALVRDFEYLGSDTRNAELGDSDEYFETKEAYDRLVALMRKIINSVGTYTNSDVNNLTAYYADYTAKAIALGNLIISTTAELDRINAYYSLTKASVNIYPEAVPAGGTTEISASVLYDGIEKIGDVSESSVSFGLTGLSSSADSTMFVFDTTLYPSASVVITSLTNSAVVTGCKEFTLKYSAIGSDGVLVKINVMLDSDSMPF